MILDSMLDHSPVLLFAVSALLGAAFGIVRLMQAGVRRVRALGRGPHAAG